MLPALGTTIGKKGQLNLPLGGPPLRFQVVDEIRQEQRSFLTPMEPTEGKVIVLQKLLFDTGMTEFRLGYYITGKKPRNLGKWVWGQFASMIPPDDFRALIEKARAKGWV